MSNIRLIVNLSELYNTFKEIVHCNIVSYMSKQTTKVKNQLAVERNFRSA